MNRTNVAVSAGYDPGTLKKSRSCSSSTPNRMGHGPGRPAKKNGPPHEPGGATHVEPTFHGPRAARQNTWAASSAGRSDPYI